MRHADLGGRIVWRFAGPLCLVLTLAATSPAEAAPKDEGGDVVEIRFLYGSEKQKWIDAVTPRFNANPPKTTSGRKVKVTARPAGSGEMIYGLLDPKREEDKADIISPAGGAFIDLGNYESRETKGEDLVGQSLELVNSPIVLAMWREQAEAIGWGKRPIRWREIFDYAREPALWAKATKHPEWGPLKFGHTHPDFSNSGLHALFLEVYAALNKFEGVTRLDLVDKHDVVDQYLREVEHAVIHYGSSTGFLGKKMSAQGRSYLDAAILYENLVIEANQAAHERDPKQTLPRVVAIYPDEGTFSSEHPIAVVLRPWVTDDHREAGELYIRYLRDRAQQAESQNYGFRPSDPGVPPSNLFRKEMGVEPTPLKSFLKTPPPSAFSAISAAWAKNKRSADVVLAVDISKSMRKADKIRRVEDASQLFIGMLGESDFLSVILFGAEVEWQAPRGMPMTAKGKASAQRMLKDINPDYDTALFAAITEAHQFLTSRDPGRIRAIVLLSDGNDTKHRTNIEDVVARIRLTDKDPIHIFTIAYGADSDPKLLARIAKATEGEAFEDTDDHSSLQRIREIFVKIVTFF